ncbi:hypothetical protein H8E77_35930 [bacterium]|nr:hypothetical protein [bacterium]
MQKIKSPLCSVWIGKSRPTVGFANPTGAVGRVIFFDMPYFVNHDDAANPVFPMAPLLHWHCLEQLAT